MVARILFKRGVALEQPQGKVDDFDRHVVGKVGIGNPHSDVCLVFVQRNGLASLVYRTDFEHCCRFNNDDIVMVGQVYSRRKPVVVSNPLSAVRGKCLVFAGSARSLRASDALRTRAAR